MSWFLFSVVFPILTLKYFTTVGFFHESRLGCGFLSRQSALCSSAFKNHLCGWPFLIWWPSPGETLFDPETRATSEANDEWNQWVKIKSKLRFRKENMLLKSCGLQLTLGLFSFLLEPTTTTVHHWRSNKLLVFVSLLEGKKEGSIFSSEICKGKCNLYKTGTRRTLRRPKGILLCTFHFSILETSEGNSNGHTFSPNLFIVYLRLWTKSQVQIL